MKKLVALLIVLFVLSACSTGPTADQIAATVNAQVASTLAAVPTNTPHPTNTPVSTATSTPKPTNTPKPPATEAPKATPTLTANDMLSEMNYLLRAIGAEAEVIDARYENGAKGEQTILHVDIRSTANTYDSVLAYPVVLLQKLIKDGFKVRPNLGALNVIAYDKTMKPKGTVAAKWSDVLDYFSGKITTEQLALRIVITGQ